MNIHEDLAGAGRLVVGRLTYDRVVALGIGTEVDLFAETVGDGVET